MILDESTETTTSQPEGTRGKQSLEQRREAERLKKQRQRAAAAAAGETTVGGKGGPSSLGNRFRWDFGPLAKAGESVSPKEAEKQLRHAHIAAAKVLGSTARMEDLKEEFEVAGESFATVANHIWPPLRLAIRFIAPLVLAGALIAIWAAILVETPWVKRLGDWWTTRQRDDTPQPVAESWNPPHVVQPPNPPAPPPAAYTEESAEHPPIPDVRSMRQR